jgi:hypothetical protein
MPESKMNIESMSQDHCDHIALLKNCVVGGLKETDGFTRGDVSDFRVGDWAFQWVGTRGSERKGLLVLKPTNRRTKTLMIKGRAQHIKRNWGFTHSEAVRLVEAMRGEQYVNESSVLSLIAQSCYDLWWIEYVQRPDQQNQLIATYQDKYPELRDISKARMDTAAKVILKFRKAMGVTV